MPWEGRRGRWPEAEPDSCLCVHSHGTGHRLWRQRTLSPTLMSCVLPATPHLLRHPLVHGPQHGMQRPWGIRGHGVRASLGLLPESPHASVEREAGKTGSGYCGRWSKNTQKGKLLSPAKPLSVLLYPRQTRGGGRRNSRPQHPAYSSSLEAPGMPTQHLGLLRLLP